MKDETKWSKPAPILTALYFTVPSCEQSLVKNEIAICLSESLPE